jgi:hypothetical protein
LSGFPSFLEGILDGWPGPVLEFKTLPKRNRGGRKETPQLIDVNLQMYCYVLLYRLYPLGFGRFGHFGRGPPRKALYCKSKKLGKRQTESGITRRESRLGNLVARQGQPVGSDRQVGSGSRISQQDLPTGFANGIY